MITNLPRDEGLFVRADPSRCRVWRLRERTLNLITEESCSAELVSVERVGQLVPAIGRPFRDDPNLDVEIICGARRLFVARHLHIPLRVQILELTDREAAITLEAERHSGAPSSPYERGLWLAELDAAELYHSQDELARELSIAPAQLIRLLKMAALPSLVVEAFSRPEEIRESWALELHRAWSDERHLLLERASALARQTPRPPAAIVYQMLLAQPSRARRGRRIQARSSAPHSAGSREHPRPR
jgi:ParB family transcriptional regulator, chromosome partitioning protein